MTGLVGDRPRTMRSLENAMMELRTLFPRFTDATIRSKDAAIAFSNATSGLVGTFSPFTARRAGSPGRSSGSRMRSLAS